MEKLAKSIYKEMLADGTPVTMEEAMEMAAMEMKSKQIKNYVKSEEPKPKSQSKKPREKKIDQGKADIIKILHKALTDSGYNAIITNVDKLIELDNYTVNLVKHRAHKE